MCLRPQRGAFSGVRHTQTVASKKSLFYHSAKRLVSILLAGAVQGRPQLHLQKSHQFQVYVLRPRCGLGQASPSLEAPRLQALETRDLFSATEQKGKDCYDQNKQAQGASFGFVFGWHKDKARLTGTQNYIQLLKSQQVELVQVDGNCSKTKIQCKSRTPMSRDHENWNKTLHSKLRGRLQGRPRKPQSSLWKLKQCDMTKRDLFLVLPLAAVAGQISINLK